MKLLLVFLLAASSAFAGKLKIDNSEVAFSINKFKIGAMVDGKFKKVKGSVDFDKKSNSIKDVWAQIDIDSIDTASEKRDGHLKSPDFFDMKKYPNMTFISTGSTKLAKKAKIKGNLTLKGVTKEVELEVKNFKNTKKGVEIEAATVVDRYAFGITWNKRMDTEKAESVLEQIANATKGLINKYVIDNKVNVKLKITAK